MEFRKLMENTEFGKNKTEFEKKKINRALKILTFNKLQLNCVSFN